jgi:hypothetical protein
MGANPKIHTIPDASHTNTSCPVHASRACVNRLDSRLWSEPIETVLELLPEICSEIVNMTMGLYLAGLTDPKWSDLDRTGDLFNISKASI